MRAGVSRLGRTSARVLRISPRFERTAPVNHDGLRGSAVVRSAGLRNDVPSTQPLRVPRVEESGPQASANRVRRNAPANQTPPFANGTRSTDVRTSKGHWRYAHRRTRKRRRSDAVEAIELVGVHPLELPSAAIARARSRNGWRKGHERGMTGSTASLPEPDESARWARS